MAICGGALPAGAVAGLDDILCLGGGVASAFGKIEGGEGGGFGDG